MSTLFAGLDIAQRALYAQQLGLEITQQNISNVNTPGYTRLRVNFEPATESSTNPPQAGSGIVATTVESYRNEFIDYNINHELQGQGEQQAAFDALQQVQAVFNASDGQGLQSALSDFFNSFSSLANTPEDLTLRQQVLQKATALQNEFHRVYGQVQAVQLQQDQLVSSTVDEINSTTASIAHLNTLIAAGNGGQSGDESGWRDERQRMLDKLSGLLDISYYEDPTTGMMTVTTSQGTLLAAGAQADPLETAPSATNGFQAVIQNGVDITSTIRSGKLGGAIKARDSMISGYLNDLDDLAAALISKVNDQHAMGLDLNGNPGGEFFAPFTPLAPGSSAGAARSIAVAVTDPELIAAAGPGGGPGSNGNAQLLAGINDAILSPALGKTADQMYAGLIYQVGSDTQDAQNGLQTQQSLVQQLQNQRDAFAGVNLDDEAVNIIKYQKAYQASARFMAVIDSISTDLLNILGG